MASTLNRAKTSNEDEESMYAMELTSVFVLPMALKAAIELEVLEIIAKASQGAPLSATQIASHLPTTNPDAPTMLDRILRLLATYSILTCSLVTHDGGRTERLYGLSPVCKFFIDNQDGVSLAPMVLLLQDKVFIQIWYHLKDAVLEGGLPFEKAQGMNAFDYCAMDARCNKLFNRAMLNYSTVVMKKLLETYVGFEGLKDLVDVGGGVGVTLNIIISKYPHIKGINYDLSHVVADATSYTGIEHVGGDMFVSVPNGEAIFMKWILHDWSDEDCLKILKNCYKALPNFGKVIVVESVLPSGPEADINSRSIINYDILMLGLTPGGKERSEKEFEALAKEAGFAGFRVVCGAFNFWVMEFYKNI